jgi:tRNA pseudouridine38-40 synthase
MPRFQLIVEYLGTRYSGWQVQPNARTVAGELGRAIREVTGRDRFDLYGAGRTDAGVHALQQFAHLDVATTLPADVLVSRINSLLPHDIVVVSAKVTSHRFHARRDAVRRCYLYQVSQRPLAFGKQLVWWVKDPLDVPAMRRAAKYFEGLHDFRAFTDAAPEEGSTRVLVERVIVQASPPFILIRVVGSHFLWKMVRRMVGVLVDVGRGGLSVEDVPNLLGTASPVPARLTAPASGLFLERVFYKDDPDAERPLTPVLAL